MALPFLSQAWVDAFCTAINASATYREKGADWTHGPVVLAVETGGGTKYLRLNVHAGRCEGISILADPDPAATMTLRAPYEVWRDLLQNRGNPAVEIAKKRIQFVGNWLLLIRHQDAARILIDLAADLDTGWEQDG